MKVIKKIIPPSVFLFILLLSSCERLFIEPNPTNTPTGNFNYLWQTINDKYSFLDYKKINWDSVKNVWQPRVSDTMNDGSPVRRANPAFSVLRESKVLPASRARHLSQMTAHPVAMAIS